MCVRIILEFESVGLRNFYQCDVGDWISQNNCSRSVGLRKITDVIELKGKS